MSIAEDAVGRWALRLACLIWAFGIGAKGATNIVQMVQSGTDFFFTPTNIIIHPGDTITWTNTDINAHDTTHNPASGATLWSSPLLSSLTHGTFSFKFASPGVYPYFCRTHFYRGHNEETGVVRVVNLPPTVSIVSPSDGAVLAAPASFAIEANPADSDGRISRVDFFSGANLWGTVSNSPYVGFVTGLGAGKYGLKAITTDDQGGRGTSAVVNVTVLSTFSLDAATAGGGFVLPDPDLEKYPSNTVVTVTATPTAGWVFLGWMGDTNSLNPSITLRVNRNLCVQATFGTTIQTSVDGSGSLRILPTTSFYPFGTAVLLVAEAQPGNYFLNWSAALSGTANPQAFVVDSGAPVVTARFAPLPQGQLSLVTSPLGFGRVAFDPPNNLYASNETVTLTAYPENGQSFNGWSGDASGTENPLAVVMDKSKLIQGNFSRRPSLALNLCPGWTPGQAVPLVLSGEPGSYEIDSSSNLVRWSSSVIVTNVYGTVQASDTSASGRLPRFYRALRP